MPAPVITDTDFDRFRDFFHGRTGIRFGDTKRYFVDRRLQACIAQAGETTFAGWFSSLRLGRDPALLQSLINELTVNETYFLREDYQFDCLTTAVLPKVLTDRTLLGRSHEPLRILSLPCSTGEEPYSIALKLVEDWPEIDRVDVSIHGCDIDTDVLALARDGWYGRRSLQRVPPAWLARHFTPGGGGRYRISADIRGAIEFDLMNITDPHFARGMAPFDVVFCRNLLIYFDEHSARQATENLYSAMHPGGYLFLGHSESMSRISGIFAPRRFPQGMVYQRPARGQS
jgi:chemotaxis protein methyltransferase CheR